jgi:two-component system chemotaxis response regulator CheY
LQGGKGTRDPKGKRCCANTLREGGGTNIALYRFRMRRPFREKAARVALNAGEIPGFSDEGNIGSQMKQVLTVDDSSSVRQMVGFTLRKAGYEVVEAVDGRQGIEKARAQKCDLVITDLNMPQMDGIQMIAGVRQLPGYSFTPILMLTTESQPEKKDAGRKAGATGWIVKPFQAEQLIAVVQKLVR